ASSVRALPGERALILRQRRSLVGRNRFVQERHGRPQRLGQLATLMASPQMPLDRVVFRLTRRKRPARQHVEYLIAIQKRSFHSTSPNLLGAGLVTSPRPPNQPANFTSPVFTRCFAPASLHPIAAAISGNV